MRVLACAKEEPHSDVSFSSSEVRRLTLSGLMVAQRLPSQRLSGSLRTSSVTHCAGSEEPYDSRDDGEIAGNPVVMVTPPPPFQRKNPPLVFPMLTHYCMHRRRAHMHINARTNPQLQYLPVTHQLWWYI